MNSKTKDALVVLCLLAATGLARASLTSKSLVKGNKLRAPKQNFVSLRCPHVCPPSLPFMLLGKGGKLEGHLPPSWHIGNPLADGSLPIDLGGMGELIIHPPFIHEDSSPLSTLTLSGRARKFPGQNTSILSRETHQYLQLLLAKLHCRVLIDAQVRHPVLIETLRRWAKQLKLSTSTINAQEETPRIERVPVIPSYPLQLCSFYKMKDIDTASYTSKTANTFFEKVLFSQGLEDDVEGLGELLLSALAASRGRRLPSSCPQLDRIYLGWHLPLSLTKNEVQPPQELRRNLQRELASPHPFIVILTGSNRRKAAVLLNLSGENGNESLTLYLPSQGSIKLSLDDFQKHYICGSSCKKLLQTLDIPLPWLDPTQYPLEAARCRQALATSFSRI